MSLKIKIGQKSLGLGTAILFGCLLVNLMVVSSIVVEKRDSVIMPYFNDTLYRYGPGADFFALYHAGVSVKNNQNPYKYVDDGITPLYYKYRYLPAFAYVGQFFTYFQPQVAYGLWVTILELALFGFIIFLFKHRKNEIDFYIVASCLLVSAPYFLEVHMGQFTFLTTVLCILSLMSEKIRNKAFFFATSVFIKPYTLLLTPLWLKNKSTRSVALVSILAILVSVPIFILHTEQWQRFYHSNANPVGWWGAGNFSLMQMLFLLSSHLNIEFWAKSHALYTGILRNLILLISLLLVMRRQGSLIVLGSLLLLAHFVSYPQVWEHHMSAVCCIIAALVISNETSKLHKQISMACLIAMALPTPFYFFNRMYTTDLDSPFLGWPITYLYILVLSKALPMGVIFVATFVETMKTKVVHVSQGGIESGT